MAWGLIPKGSIRGQAQSASQTSPGMALILQRAGTIRYGVRAFSTLEGYAGRNRETELALTAERRENARPPSRFSSEMGTKADAKQQLEGFRALVRLVCRRGQEQPDEAVRG